MFEKPSENRLEVFQRLFKGLLKAFQGPSQRPSNDLSEAFGRSFNCLLKAFGGPFIVFLKVVFTGFC